MYWNVHMTHRGPTGDVRKEFVGAYQQSELPAVLEEAFRQADAERGGVQVTKRRDRDCALAESA